MLKAFAAGALLTIAMPTGWVEAKDTPGAYPPTPLVMRWV